MPANRVSELEKFLLPKLRESEREFSIEYPEFRFSVWSSSVGSSTNYQGHNLGIECCFPDARDFEADCVALVFGVRHITTTPELCEASVDWGQGDHPNIQIGLLNEALPFTSENLHTVTSRLPELLVTFRNALSAWQSR
jgi:hypothetical protein